MNVLKLLNIRFQRIYYQSHITDMLEFQIDISLFYEISHTLSELLASSITKNDFRFFNNDLEFRNNFQCEDFNKWLKSLNRFWNAWCENVADCVKVESMNDTAFVKLAVISVT